jgi:hypothetical protein
MRFLLALLLLPSLLMAQTTDSVTKAPTPRPADTTTTTWKTYWDTVTVYDTLTVYDTVIVQVPGDSTNPPPTLACSTGCWYVDPAGDDAAAGSSAAPFRTLQKAANVVNPGDTVLVRPGVYTNVGNTATIVNVTRGGSLAAGYVRFICVERLACKVDGRTNTNVEGWDIQASYVAVEGFDIYGLQGYGFVYYTTGANHLEILGNHISNIGRYCFTGTNARSGISIGSGTRNVLFRGNKWGPGIGRLDPSEPGGTCYGTSTVYMNHDHGIYVADTDSITVQQDTFVDFKRGWAIQRYKSGGYTTKALWILDNVFSGANPYRDGQIILATATTGVKINGNTSNQPRAGFISRTGGTQTGEVRNNVTNGGVTLLGGASQLTLSGTVENP